MKLAIALLILAAALPAAAQEPYKCNIGGAWVYQDRPCPGAVRRSDNMPPKPAINAPAAAGKASPNDDEAARLREKLDKDKEYIDQRVKARNFEREKDQAAEQLRNCYSEADAIQQRINQIAASSPQGVPLDRASAINLQLDQQRRLTDIAALQSQATAKRSECDIRRDEFNRIYRK